MDDDHQVRADDQNEAVAMLIYVAVFLAASGISQSYGLSLWMSIAVGVAISALGALAHRWWVSRGARGEVSARSR